MHALILCRPLSDAEKRLHEAAKNGKCDEIRALAAEGTDMSCRDPDNVRRLLINEFCMWIEVVRAWPSHQPVGLLWGIMTRMQLGTYTRTLAR